MTFCTALYGKYKILNERSVRFTSPPSSSVTLLSNHAIRVACGIWKPKGNGSELHTTGSIRTNELSGQSKQSRHACNLILLCMYVSLDSSRKVSHIWRVRTYIKWSCINNVGNFLSRYKFIRNCDEIRYCYDDYTFDIIFSWIISDEVRSSKPFVTYVW